MPNFIYPVLAMFLIVTLSACSEDVEAPVPALTEEQKTAQGFIAQVNLVSSYEAQLAAQGIVITSVADECDPSALDCTARKLQVTRDEL